MSAGMLTDNMHIRIATITDAPRILEIQKKAFQCEAGIYGRDDLPPLTQTLDSIIDDFKRFDYFKAIYNNVIVGSVRASISGNTCFIGRLIVDPEYHKQGFGSKLMDFLEEKYNLTSRFELFTGKKSEGNIRFYNKRGYKIFGEFSDAGNIEMVKMEKRPSEKFCKAE